MIDTFGLNILSGMKIRYTGQARYCGVTTPTGSIGFQAKHEGFISSLEPGSQVQFTTDSGDQENLQISRGMLLFENNQCTITVTEVGENQT